MGTPVAAAPADVTEHGESIHTSSLRQSGSERALPASHIFHYHVAPNGCPTRVTDTKGHIAWSASSTTWGVVTRQHAHAITNPLRFQGQYFDTETALHYNRYRYYDPQSGQFVGQDPLRLMGGLNIYLYAVNPTGWADPTGLMPWFGTNGAWADITVDGVTKNFASGGTHAEIKGLKWFLEQGGGFDGKHVVISNVIGDKVPEGMGPIGVCTKCRTSMFDYLIEGNASSVTIPKTINGNFKGNIKIDASNFEHARSALQGIRNGPGTDTQKSQQAWKTLESMSCRS
jgi:RHS repeat-associated protein